MNITRDRARDPEVYLDLDAYAQDLQDSILAAEYEAECQSCGEPFPMHPAICDTCAWDEALEARYGLDEDWERSIDWAAEEAHWVAQMAMEQRAVVVMHATKGFSPEARAHALRACGIPA